MIWFLLACGPSDAPVAHEVDEGYYTVVVPDGVDPATAPILVHLHANGLGAATAAKADVQQALADEGLVGVFPEGWGDDASTDWNVGDNRHAIPRDDIAFLRDVADDLLDRYSGDGLWLGGSSKGGAMTWELACLADDSPFDGFLPIAGAIEKTLPGPCVHPPRPLRHLQGRRDDDHWPLHTADAPTSSHMGIIDSFQALADTDPACIDATVAEDADGCQRFAACGAERRLCWHEGGHRLPSDWVARQAASMRSLGR